MSSILFFIVQLHKKFTIGTNLINAGDDASFVPYEYISIQFGPLDDIILPFIRNLQGMPILEMYGDEGRLKHLSKSWFETSTAIQVLSLSKHWFEEISFIDQIFSGQRQLQELYLENNGIISWNVSDDVKGDVLPELRLLSLSGNPIEVLHNDSFDWLRNSKLETLILRDCASLMKIDSGLLLPVSGSLQYLDLTRSGMSRKLLSNLIGGLGSVKNSQLVGLGLAQMGLTEIPGILLNNVANSLKYLSLFGNHFSFKSLRGEEKETLRAKFPHMPQLEELDLRANNMNFLPRDVLKPLCNLRKLLLGNNKFTNLHPEVFQHVKKLNFLSLTHNEIEYPDPEHKLDDYVFSPITGLEILDLSFSTLNQLTNNTFKGLYSLKKLLLQSTKLKNIQNECFADLGNLEYLDISENKIEGGLPTNAFGGLKKLKELHARNCELDLGNISLDDLHSITTIDLTANNIEKLEMLTNSNMSKLTTLILAENKIVNWQQQLFSKSSVTTLVIARNLLTEINQAMQNDFKKLKTVDASENPYQCYCSMENLNLRLNLTYWPQSYTCQTNNSSLIQVQNISSRNCLSNGSPIKNNEINEYNENKSEHSKNIVAVISVVSGLLMFTIISIICWWKWWYIHTWARILYNSAWFSIMNDEDDVESNTRDEKFFYDVFVSYSDSDRSWIMDHLLPNLEANYQVKVCLHERDFKAGLSILENIMLCMEQSRSILLVLSKAFLRSHWCQFELNMAQHRLLEMKRDHLLLVLLEPVPREHCSKMMRYLMLTKTYLQWPPKDKDTCQQEEQLFWKRLRKAVGCTQDITISVA